MRKLLLFWVCFGLAIALPMTGVIIYIDVLGYMNLLTFSEAIKVTSITADVAFFGLAIVVIAGIAYCVVEFIDYCSAKMVTTGDG